MSVFKFMSVFIKIYIEDNKYYLKNVMEKVIPKSKPFIKTFPNAVHC